MAHRRSHRTQDGDHGHSPPERGFAPREAHEPSDSRRTNPNAGSVRFGTETPIARRGLAGEPGVPPRLRRAFALGSLALASALCVGALVARWVYADWGAYRFLSWNLFLAWIPLVAALAVYDLRRRGSPLVRLLPLAAVWLAFLPNAPYLLTDFVHLGSRDDAPLWFDIILFGSFAWTGMLLGFLSIFVMQGVVRSAAGPVWGWVLAGASSGASAFGIYLGRSLGWNSWDFVVRPGALLEDIWARLADPLAYPRGVGMTLALTALLATGYLTMYAFAQLGAAERVDAARR